MALCTWADGNAHVHLHIGFVHSQVNFFFFFGSTCTYTIIFAKNNVLFFCLHIRNFFAKKYVGFLFY